jgi:hypothetical protein
VPGRGVTRCDKHAAREWGLTVSVWSLAFVAAAAVQRCALEGSAGFGFALRWTEVEPASAWPLGWIFDARHLGAVVTTVVQENGAWHQRQRGSPTIPASPGRSGYAVPCGNRTWGSLCQQTPGTAVLVQPFANCRRSLVVVFGDADRLWASGRLETAHEGVDEHENRCDGALAEGQAPAVVP